MGLVTRLLPAPTAQFRAEALAAGQHYLHSLGITGWQDANVQPQDIDSYRRLLADGRPPPG